MKLLPFISVFVLLFASESWSQTATMRIHLKDGRTLGYNVDSIVNARITHVDAPHYNYLRAFRHTFMAPYEGWLRAKSKPMLEFERDLEGYRVLIVLGDTLRILSPVDPPDRLDAPLDSIVIFNYYRDTNLISVDPDLKYGFFVSATWNGDTMYASRPLTQIVFNSNFTTKTNPKQIAKRARTYSLDYHPQRSRILTVGSKYEDASVGDLYEYDPSTKAEILIDSGFQISRAVYDPLDSSNVYFYAYGSYDYSTNPKPTDAGYYVYNRITKSRKLLLAYISDMGPGEGINGFDVHPTQAKLLLPFVKPNTKPEVVEFDLTTSRLDTLDIDFDWIHGRVCLWVSYNSDGSKIVYSNYPEDTFVFGYAAESSEVGIIDRSTLQKRIIPTVPDTYHSAWIALMPEFVPGRNAISFSASEIALEPPLMVGEYRLYILKNLSE